MTKSDEIELLLLC